ncbi:MAG TPA: MFS transporter, partial [Bradyrhizobium sp.]|nr:MFS transporter [Bradyrhizobium sp.]
MALAVNAGARLDRLPISSFHYRIFWLVGAGMFFDGYDLYIAGGVLASAIQTKFSTAPQNLQFISLTFVGMTLGALITGFVGDKFGRRFTYQINLLIFGLASLAAAFAQDMNQLIACCFMQGLGLGAEIVVGYSTLTEFVPPKTRGRWLSMMAFIVVAGFPVTALLGYLIIPAWGWRPMFIIAGGVLASAVQSKFSTVPQNLQFISLTFVGMTLGALITGFVGDKMGRRFTYQINLLIFGLASLAAAFAQDMNQLIA